MKDKAEFWMHSQVKSGHPQSRSILLPRRVKMDAGLQAKVPGQLATSGGEGLKGGIKYLAQLQSHKKVHPPRPSIHRFTTQ